jgi:L-ascorbate metabolism protein UlaG (beta-lactamase superfamily)
MALKNVRWLGHSSFLITSEIEDITLYIDPYNITTDAIANYILITHTHYDHFSFKDVMNISNKDTKLFAPPDAQPKLKDYIGEVIIVEPNSRYQVENLIVDTVPAYNLLSGFHPESNNWVGYIFEMDKKRYYHAGDTDLLEELKNIKDIYVAMLPVGGTYTMNAEQAAELANTIKPQYFVPMHYGTIIGDVSDAEKAKEIYNGETVILQKD